MSNKYQAVKKKKLTKWKKIDKDIQSCWEKQSN